MLSINPNCVGHLSVTWVRGAQWIRKKSRNFRPSPFSWRNCLLKKYCRIVPPAPIGLMQKANVGMLSRQNERNSSLVRLAHISTFGFFLSICLIKSNCYSLMYSSLIMAIAIVILNSTHFYNFKFSCLFGIYFLN